MGKSYRRNDEYGNKYRGYRKNSHKSSKNKNYRGNTEKDYESDVRWDFQNQEVFR